MFERAEGRVICIVTVVTSSADPGADSWVKRKSKRLSLRERKSKLSRFVFLLTQLSAPRSPRMQLLQRDDWPASKLSWGWGPHPQESLLAGCETTETRDRSI